MLGRYRRLTDLVRHKERSKRTHGLRVAINTPIQGSAADIVNAAMIKVYIDPLMKELGWEMVLQIHDEIIMEGPTENSEAALKRLVELMENPLDEPLKVDLVVDAAIVQNWYEGK